MDVTLLKAISDMGWNLPTPIQTEAVPAGLAGRDIFAQAQTGTGKTGTYALIIMGRTESGSKKPTSLVLAPTRELATQVENEIYKLSKYTGHRSISIYGGASIGDQTYGLRKGVDIVVGTPGRLKDMITRGALDLSEITEVVLDEADRMLDMGFADELDFIMDAVPKDRHTLLFSATMAESIKRIAFKRMQDPMEISVSRDEPVSDLVTQYWIPMSRGAKMERLESILTNGCPKTVVFCQTKKMVDTLADEMYQRIKVGTLHGDMPQAKRERTIRSFRNNRFQVLIATDVAARGLDINNIDLVVNYDLPMDSENYLHRIGRTGRAGKEGIAVSFVTKQEEYHIRQYERETGKKILKVRADEMPSAGTMVIEDQVRAPAKAQRQFATVPINDTKKPVRPVIATTEDGKKMVVLQINLGRDDGFSKTQISDLVKRVGKLEDVFVGNVGLGRSKSFIEIREDRSDRTMATMSEYLHKKKEVLMEPADKKPKYQEKKHKSYGQY
ncbi:MAG: DEAD/DEAH box helicase [Candidatus Methanomethylophilaceae archaeon]|nr:DEAD/DEAH box helicase [Candidatus Methanomethylophilaceae archaeon]MDY0251787.1 DEAD/DEAH box helicase [Candidatus Methanomethylophilaceae archaeon]